jgi:soluble lytic murein transglycosylase
MKTTFNLYFALILLAGALVAMASLDAHADGQTSPTEEPAISSEDEKALEVEMTEMNQDIQSMQQEIHAVDQASPSSLSQAERERRLDHARELLGKYYKKSVVRGGEYIKKVNGMVYRWTRKQLPKAFKKDYMKIAQTIIDQSLKYEFDPIFLLAVISNESKFDPSIVGDVGEIGLMQIRPTTAKWITDLKGVKYRGKKSLRDPIVNIKIGSAFLAFLREEFDSHARLYLAAYNMGQGNVRHALSKKVWPKEYAAHVMQHYVGYYNELAQVE